MNTFERIATIPQNNLVGLPYSVIADSQKTLTINNIFYMFYPILTHEVTVNIISSYKPTLNIIEVYNIVLNQL